MARAKGAGPPWANVLFNTLKIGNGFVCGLESVKRLERSPFGWAWGLQRFKPSVRSINGNGGGHGLGLGGMEVSDQGGDFGSVRHGWILLLGVGVTG
tara:strand:+ start:145 stop:435 length:291 start_codon:yes stop_codon:yes gene_type:complete